MDSTLNLLGRRRQSILLLYMVNDTGHSAAARAIQEALSIIRPSMPCSVHAISDHVYSQWGGLTNRLYLLINKYCPALWGWVYNNPHVFSATKGIRNLLTILTRKKIHRFISEHKPRTVVCTQAVATASLARLKKSGLFRGSLIAVITDFRAHAYWVHPEIDIYIVAHAETKLDLINLGVPHYKIRIIGIPVHPNFSRPSDLKYLRQKYNVANHKKIVLLMGGSLGRGNFDALIDQFKPNLNQFHLFILTGKNNQLRNSLLKKNIPGIEPLAHCVDTSKIMGGADLILTKPGGLSCSEIMAVDRPFIIINSSPGQEKLNFEFLNRNNANLKINDSELLITEINKYFKYKEGQAASIIGRNLLSRPLAAFDAARIILARS